MRAAPLHADVPALSRRVRRVSWTERVFGWFLALIVPVSLTLFWDFAVKHKLVPVTLIPTPLAVLQAFLALVKNGQMQMHCVISGKRLAGGYALGTLAGLFAGIVVGCSRVGARLFEPTLSVLAPIPAIAWVPLLIILLGIGEPSKIGLVALGTFFIITLNVVQGIRSTEREYVELAQVLGKRGWELLTRVLLPSALPQIFTGLRIALALSWTLLLISEIIASSSGLGWLIWDARNFSRIDDMFVGIIAVGILGRASDLLLLAVERVMTRWRATYGTWLTYGETLTNRN